MTAMGKTKIA